MRGAYYALIVPLTGDVVMYLPGVHYRWLGSKPLPGYPRKQHLEIGETSMYAFRAEGGVPLVLKIRRIARDEMVVGIEKEGFNGPSRK